MLYQQNWNVSFSYFPLSIFPKHYSVFFLLPLNLCCKQQAFSWQHGRKHFFFLFQGICIQWELYLFISFTWHLSTGSQAFLTPLLYRSSCFVITQKHFKGMDWKVPLPLHPAIYLLTCLSNTKYIIISHYQMGWFQIRD